MNEPTRSLPEPPGTRQARVTGLLSIIFAITLIGIPIAIVLAVVSLVQSSRCRYSARAMPLVYRMPTNTATILGVVGISISGLLLIPAILAAPLAYFAFRGHRIDAEVQQQLRLLELQKIELEQQRATLRIQQLEQLRKTVASLETELMKATSIERSGADSSKNRQSPTRISVHSTNQELNQQPNPPLNSDPACIAFRSFSSSRYLGFAQRLGAGGAG